MTHTDFLKKVTLAIYPLTNEEWLDYLEVWKPYSCKRKTCLTAVGQREDYLYFITEGLQRIF
ncbi:cyclic nucleotide binding regulatory protein [Lunatimonas lonarensis]|uniref:Cyclic nucleotide binding regulatory protein n=1 Tax=Lunatimonas lonarensis TaxID=1232681 RepID=R7ZWA6_9BACT|nr:hypothetical protein [Lunatimonas lonarensis]EON78367.1 cyclic nucleotide binding regulatory protein [Lunatimonas lonarensis]